MGNILDKILIFICSFFSLSLSLILIQTIKEKIDIFTLTKL